MNLKNLRITGFISFPSRSLQDAQPEAYHNAIKSIMTQHPNAGVCAHCGMGIIHNVLVTDADGVEHCIGTDCAERVGADPVALRQRLTTAEREARDAKHEAKVAKWRAEQEAQAALVASRKEAFASILNALRNAEPYNPARETFGESLANQLEHGPLSARQAFYAAKIATGFKRRNKANAAEWDAIEAAVQQ